MKKIRIHSSPEYKTPKEDYCISIVENIFRFARIDLYYHLDEIYPGTLKRLD